MELKIKDPDAVKNYGFDWSKWLEDDTIAASEWSADTGITIDSNSFNTTHTVVVLSGGTAGSMYVVTNHITTAAGYEEDQSLAIRVKEK